MFNEKERAERRLTKGTSIQIVQKKRKITVSKTNNMSTYIKIKKERLYRRERKRVLFV